MILDVSIILAYFIVIMAIGVRARRTSVQANLEINAIFGILVAAFFFIPLYLRMKVITITQLFEAIPHFV